MVFALHGCYSERIKQRDHTTMSGYQFIHVESYARTAAKSKKGGHSLASIVAEAERHPGACPHIEHTQPPRQLHGCTPAQAAEEAAAWAEVSKDELGRKLRKDGLCMLAGVVSLPHERQQDWPQLRDDTVKYLQQRYGDRLKCVIEHTDEQNPHLHFYAVPLPGERFEVLHEGRKAAQAVKQASKPKGEQNQAYKAAMRAYQDDFYEHVGKYHGLARIGPQRQRLSRSAWKAQQKASETMADAHRILRDGVTPVEPTERQAVNIDWEAARKAAGEPQRNLWGKESYTPEQLQQAMLEAARQAIRNTRKQEDKRYAPVIKYAQRVDAAQAAADRVRRVENRNAELRAQNEEMRGLLGLFDQTEIEWAQRRRQQQEAERAQQERERVQEARRLEAQQEAAEQERRAQNQATALREKQPQPKPKRKGHDDGGGGSEPGF